MDINRINELINKYSEGTASKTEEEEINAWYRETGYQDAEFPEDEDEAYYSMLAALNKATKPKSEFGNFRKWAIAASIAVFLTSGIALYIVSHQSKKISAQITGSLISPGKNCAVLTLANGKKIFLNDVANGDLATQGNLKITKTKSGQLIYTIKASTDQTLPAPVANDQAAFNTIETPAGGQYQIVLPDQSKVWLNSMSSIKFPVSFDNMTERRVELSGEGYFEVMHNDKIPFKVVTGFLVTEDIGTSFNIKAYTDDENIKMTLVKGAASVTDGKVNALLKPGQQATYHTSIKVSEVSVEDVIAWRNGYFRFDDDNLEDIMKTISRWYSIKYVFKDEGLKQETFGAVTNRFTDINDLLKLIENAGLAHFQIEGRTIIISKKNN